MHCAIPAPLRKREGERAMHVSDERRSANFLVG
jgi:hypothetical protein